MIRNRVLPRLYPLFLAAMLVTLAACGAVPTSGVASSAGPEPTTNAPAAQPTGGAATTANAPAAQPTAGADATATSGTVTGQGGSVSDQASLIDALRKAGATVTIGDSIEQPFLSVTGTQITVNGADVQVFEYADEAAAQADATKLADTLAGKGTTMITWVASPHAYRAGRVIALYVGDDAAVLKLLQDTMGAPFAEQQLPPQAPQP